MVTEPPNREEIDAKLALSEAHSDLRMAELRSEMNGQFAGLAATLGSLREEVRQSSQEARETRKQVSEESRSTRTTVIVAGLASVLAVIGVVVAVGQLAAGYEANLLSAVGVSHDAPHAAPPTAPK